MGPVPPLGAVAAALVFVAVLELDPPQAASARQLAINANARTALIAGLDLLRLV